MLFGLIKSEDDFIQTGRETLLGNASCLCTLITEYANPNRTCGICGAAMRTRQDLPAPGQVENFLFFIGGGYEEILKAGIEVKAWSEECLAKCVAVARGEDTYF